jgi:alpha-L-fucosidase
VSRGGNLLLDIGPKADGTIPVIMQQRLQEIGGWLSVNGEAIYGTRPWKETRQWSAGEMPQVKYNSEFESAYDVTKLTRKPEAGKAAIEAFFTTKGNDLYAILPRWPEGGFVVKDVTGVKEAHLLGAPQALKFKAVAGGVRIDVPSLPDDLLHQSCWVLKISH